MKRGLFLTASALLLAVLLGATAAFAQHRLGSRRVGVRWTASIPHLTFSARDLVDADVRRKLSSGLPQTIIMRVYAYTDPGGRAISMAPRSCRVVYDLWEEVYRVEVHGEARARTYTVTGLHDVLERCVVARGLPVGRAEDYRSHQGSRIYFAALLELNPMSPATVQRIRRWLARPNGRVQSEAFFGSFVSLFVNPRFGAAERVVRFRSQTLQVPR